jgi:hypothetical protein
MLIKKEKLKFAILLSGLQRNFEPFIKNQLECLIKVNNCDVFIFTSNDNLSRYAENSTIMYSENEKYNRDKDYFYQAYGENLKDIYIDFDESHFNKFRNKYFEDCGNNFHLNLIKAYFKVFSAIKMMENYESKNNIKYDGVFRARLDSFFLQKIALEKFELNNIYCSIANDSGHKDDAGVFIDRKNLYYLKTFVFELIKKRNQKTNIIVEHQLFSHLIKISKIEFIPNFINRIGCPANLKYQEVPFLNRKGFNDLTSLECKLEWDIPSEVIPRNSGQSPLLSHIYYKSKKIIKVILDSIKDYILM